MSRLLHAIGDRLAAHLLAPRPHGEMVATVAPAQLAAALRPGDVLLVEGQSRLSIAIKFLTQSNWSHAALFIGHGGSHGIAGLDGPALLEADLRDGVRAIALDTYVHMHTRICRPVGLAPPEVARLLGYAVGRIGQRYDLKNLFDLARYLLPTPPVPLHRRRRMLAFGSGDPTRAICSTLIAQAFESVRYPILPIIERVPSGDPLHPRSVKEILHVRSYTLFVPRDFDVSPYFAIVKPTLASGFDFRRLAWDDTASVPPA